MKAPSRRSRRLPVGDSGDHRPAPRRWLSLCLSVLGVLLMAAGPVFAAVRIENNVEGSNDTSASGLIVLDPDSGSSLTVSGVGNWNDGNRVDTTADTATGGHLELEHHGEIPPESLPTWWNTNWTDRICFDINNPGTPQTEFPTELVFDSNVLVSDGEMLAGGDDIRVVDSATGLELPLWVETPPPSGTTRIWTQLATMPTGLSEVCLYSGNALATTVSDQNAVFTYTTQAARYYTLSDRWNGQTLSVVSYVDNNTITAAGSTQVANRGQVVTFPGANQNTVVAANGPIAGATTSDGTDSIVPEAYASDRFMFVVNRNQQIIWVRAPFGPVTLQFEIDGAVVSTTRTTGGAAAATQTINPGDGAIGIIADAGNNEAVMVTATNGQDFVAVHNTNTRTDAVIGYPLLDEPIYGVRSRYLQVSTPATSTYSAVGSDGTSIAGDPVDATALVRTNGTPLNNDRRGLGPAMVVNSPVPIAATQYADQNGSEITNFVPYSLLEHEYFTALASSYIAVACPVAGQAVTVTEPGGAVTNLICQNPGGLAGAPGKAYVGIRSIAAGTLIESTGPIFVYVEKSAGNDEINIAGAKASRRRLALDPAVTAGPIEGLYEAAGTWSDVYDTGSAGVYGLLSVLATIPAGTGVTAQIATATTQTAADTATALGPDGTNTTFYTSGSTLINDIHNFEQFIRIDLTLTTSDPLVSPRVTSVVVSSNLTEYATSAEATTIIPISASPGLDSHLVARVHGTGSLSYDAEITYTGGTGLPVVDALTVKSDHPADHVRALLGSIVQGQSVAPFTVSSTDTFALYVDEDIQAGNVVTIDVTINATETDGVVIQHDLQFVLTS